MYNHIDWWASWYLDDYVELNDAQEAEFNLKLEELHQWHRKTQLIVYANQLSLLKKQIDHGITEEEVAMHFDLIKDHWLRLLEHSKPHLIELTSLLDQEQRTSLILAIEEQNKELKEDREDLSVEERFKKVTKEQQSQFKKWFGPLNREQKTKVAEFSGQYQSTFDDWMDYRNDWLIKFSQLLEPTQLKNHYHEQFTWLLTHQNSLKSESYQLKSTHNNEVFRKSLLYMMTNLTDKQLRTVKKRITRMIDDLHELAEE